MMTENTHFTKEWIANGRIISYRFSDVGKEAADLWYADLTALVEQWQNDRPLHLLMDLRLGNILVSSQGLMRARQITRITSSTRGRTAVLIDSAFTAQIISGLLRALHNEQRERAVFNNEEAARAWLLQNDTTSTAEIKQAPPPGFEG